jgi:hypothetical protein
MKTLFTKTNEIYDGSQLRSLFAYMTHGLLGDSVVAWIGPCSVSFDHMVDGEDLRAQAKIEGERMVHFIVEMFDCSLLAAVAAQRLLASIIMESLKNPELHRDGDDIYLKDKKFSISIATVSPTSALIHFAVNVVNDGTPVPTLSLKDLKVDPEKFAHDILEKFAKEMISVRAATQKVKWVR